MNNEFYGPFTVSALNSWTVASDRLVSSQCGMDMMVGGPYNYDGTDYITKTFSTTIPYYKIGVRIDVYKIDYWNGSSFLINAGYGTLSTMFSYSFSSSSDTTYVRNLCAGCYNEDFLDVYQEMAFSGSDVSIQFTTTLGSTANSYWGVNHFQLYIFRCDPSCNTCSDETINGCLTCYGNATLNSNNSCSCNLGYNYVENSNPCTSYPCSICSLCDISCRTCSVANKALCYSCYDGNYLSGTECLHCATGTFLIIDENTCDAYCPFGTYGENLTSTCTACDSSCATCDESTSLDCLSCNSGNYLLNGSCLTCDSQCSTCDTISTNCLSCPTGGGTYLYNNDCLADCPDNYYARDEDNTCQLCDSSCFTCAGIYDLNCTSCYNTTYLNPSPIGNCLPCDPSCENCQNISTNCTSCNNGTFYYPNECLITCPDGYWMQTSDNTCQNCDNTCATCSAGTSLDCITCPDGSFYSNGICLLCSGCETCDTTETNCLSCNSSTYLINNACVDTCPSGTWPQSDNTCQNCDGLCQTCSAGTSHDCLSCFDGNYLIGSQCALCSSICETCDTNSTNCLSCNSGTFLLGSNCITPCPDNTWADSVTNACQLCDSSCSTCQDGTSMGCLSCSTGFLSNNQCLPCSTPCNSCQTTSTTCTSCTGIYYYYLNQCVQNCPDGFYADSSSNTCLTCDPICLTCQGGYSSDCMACYPGFFVSNNFCLGCDQKCLTCDGIHSSDCLSCQPDLYLQEGSCVSVCIDGYYQTESPTKQCIKCPTTCLTCLSSDFNNCLTCANNCYFTLLDPNSLSGSCTHMACPFSWIMDPPSHTCVKQCNSSQYLDFSTNQCKMCDASCFNCSAAGLGNCFSCVSPYFLFETSCLSECPIYFVENSNTNNCDPCPKNCDTCADSSTCTNCTIGYFLGLQTAQCLDTPPSGQYVTDGKVIECAYGCQECSMFPECEECADLFYLNSANICDEEKHVQPILYIDKNIKNIFYLTFNDTWINYFNNLTTNATSYNITLEDANNAIFTCNLQYYQLNSTPNWEIIVDFKQDSPNVTQLVVNLFPIDEIPFNLTQTIVSIDVPPYVANTTVDQYIYVTPALSLSYISSANLFFNLSFSDNFTNFFDVMPNITSLTIQNLAKTDFNYTLNITNSTLNYNVSLNLKKSVLDSPLLTILFDLPGYLIFDPTYRLNTTNISIILDDIYILSPADQTQIQIMENLKGPLYSLLTPLAFIVGSLNLESLSFSGIEAVTIIQFLRYIPLKYPPQATLIFSYEVETPIFRNLENNENLEQIPLNWRKYGINANLFANGLDKLLQLLIVFGITIIFQTLSVLFAKKNNFWITIIRKLAKSFYFNIFLMFYLSYLMDLSFYCLLNLKNNILDSTIGILGFFISLIFMFLTIIVHFLLYKLIIGKSLNKVSPLKNDEKESNFQKIQNDTNIPESADIDLLKKRYQQKILSDTDEQFLYKKSENENNVKTSKMNEKELLKIKKSWCFPEEEFSFQETRKENESPIKMIDLSKSNMDCFVPKAEKPVLKEKKEANQFLNDKILIVLVDFQQESKTQNIYVLLLMIRYIVLPFMVIELYEQNYLIISFYLGFNCFYLSYILCIQPFVSLYLMVKNRAAKFTIKIVRFKRN